MMTQNGVFLIMKKENRLQEINEKIPLLLIIALILSIVAIALTLSLVAGILRSPEGANYVVPEAGSPEGGIYVAPEYADSGIGTKSDPYLNCLYNIFNLMTSSNEGEIYLPKAYYRETHGITNDENLGKPRHLALRGAGFWDSVIILGPNMNEPLITIKGHTSLYMQGIEIEGNKAQNPSYTGPMIYLIDSYDVTLRDCFLEDGHGSGIQIGAIDGTKSAWSVDIINCPIEYFDGNAITITGSNNCDMESLTLGSNHGYNIDMTGVNSSYPNAVVTNSYIVSAYQDSIRLGKYAALQASNNRFTYGAEKSYNGILFDSPSDTLRSILITNNFFETQYGLYFDSARFNNKIIVQGNDFLSCTYACNFPMNITKGIVVNNNGLNPIGKYANPFIYYGNGIYYIEPNNGKTSPTKNTLYSVQVAPCRIISVGGTNVNISIYDGKENLIKSYGGTCDIYLAIGQGINFGNFITPPTVSIYFT